MNTQITNLLRIAAFVWASASSVSFADPGCNCRDDEIHKALLPEPSTCCRWICTSTVESGTPVIGPETSVDVILGSIQCYADCRYIDSCEIPEPAPIIKHWDIESREDISGSVTQPSACWSNAEVVGFAIDVCDDIEAAGAVHDVAGYISINQNTFAGITPFDYTCNRCTDHDIEFYAIKQTNKGSWSKSVKKTWKTVPDCTPGPSCGASGGPTVVPCLPKLTCTVSRTTRTYSRVTLDQPCQCENPPCCGHVACP